MPRLLRVACLSLSLGGVIGCERTAEPSPAPAPKPVAQMVEPAATRPTTLSAVRPASVEVLRQEACSQDMVLVEGRYCPEVELRCKRYLDPEGRYERFRCAEYGPSICRSKERRAMRFCIDQHEFVPQGEVLPANQKSFNNADKTCRSLGKRVCQESEWNFACEGEAMQPYPYGFSRDAEACNADRTDIVGADGKLRDLRAPPGSHPRCASPFGVLDMTGNLEEFVAIDGSRPVRPAMKGAYWQPGRNFCRAAQTAHDRYYNGTETGFRCCADAAQ